MSIRRVTKSAIEAMQPRAAIWDTDVRGFGVRRQLRDPAYVLKYSFRQRQRFITIGRHGAPWTPETARKEAQRLLGMISEGRDPAAERATWKAEPTLADVLERYLSEHVMPHNKASTAAEVTRLVHRDINPSMGTIRISDLSRSDIKRWHSAFSDRPYVGNRALSYLAKALAIAHVEWEYRKDNPAIGVKRFPETDRSRFFSDAELSRIGQALAALEARNAVSPGAARCIRLLALSGMRLGEVLGLQWAWIDFEGGCARLPDAKAGARAVPLGGPLLVYLASLDRLGPFVCYGFGGTTGIGSKTFRLAWADVVRGAELVNARPHDFRHTVGTFTAETGANAFQVRDILGHKTMAMTGRYVERNVDPMRKTADQVSGRISAAMERPEAAPQAVVVSLRNP
jgi:integrase